MKAVIDPVVALRQAQHFGHEIPVRAAAVEIVLAGACIGEAGGYTARRGRLALGDGVLGVRLVDADVHVRIDDAGEREPVAAIDDLIRLVGPDVGREAGELPVLDADVQQINRAPVRTHDADVLDDSVKGSVHYSL